MWTRQVCMNSGLLLFGTVKEPLFTSPWLVGDTVLSLILNLWIWPYHAEVTAHSGRRARLKAFVRVVLMC